MIAVWLVIAIVCLVVIIRLLAKPDRDPYARAEADRPKELDGAVVVEARTKIRMTFPFRLHGTPDIIYKLPDGTLVVREDKSYFPHPMADRIQASVYACILRHNPPPSLVGCKVAPYGWIRYGTPGKTDVRWVRVVMFTDQEVGQLLARYRAVRGGFKPRPTNDPGYCEKVCQHYGSRCLGSRRVQRAPATVR